MKAGQRVWTSPIFYGYANHLGRVTLARWIECSNSQALFRDRDIQVDVSQTLRVSCLPMVVRTVCGTSVEKRSEKIMIAGPK